MILEELNALFDEMKIPVSTGVFKDRPPDEYVVLTPLNDTFIEHADDIPQYETQEVRISLFRKDNYIKRRNEIVRALIHNDFTITDRLYIGHEDDTGFYHYAVDVMKLYEWS